MKPCKVLCVLPATYHPRFARRIDMIREIGFEVEAIAFERDYIGGRSPNCEIELLGALSHGQLVRRVPKLLGSLRKARMAIRRNDVVYAFNPDMALFALLAGAGLSKPVAVEVADIRKAQTGKGLKGRIVRALDKLTLRNCKLLTVTSDRYFHYYRDWLMVETPGLVLENKLSASFCDEFRTCSSSLALGCVPLNRPLRIGWFGRLRDEWSLRVIEDLVGSFQGQFSIVVAGTLSPPVAAMSHLAAQNPGIKYLGPYDHPGDLPSLFNGVDMVMACNPPEVPSAWSRANRYYDACFFAKPLIVRAGGADAEETRRHDIGLVIQDNCPSAAADAIRNITPEELDRWRKNMRALPPSIYSDIEDVRALRLAVGEIAGSQ